jgi:osmotically-inducible protein OsmY
MTIAGLVLLTAGWLTPADAQQPAQSPDQRRSQENRQDRMNYAERMLEDQIYVRLAERAWVGADFDAKVDGNTVTLSGTVPSERTKGDILRITRRMPGVVDVRDQLHVKPSVGADRGGSPVPDAELAKRVAQKIASEMPGAKAGEDWWFTGWRVEGQDRQWTMIVEATDGAITLEGEVPYTSIIKKAVGTALNVQGVWSVRSELEIEPVQRYGPYYGYGYHSHAYHPYHYRYGPYAAGDPDYFVYYDASRAGGGGAARDGRSSAMQGTRDAKSVHTVTGQVTDIDRQKGALTFKTDQGSFDLQLPPASLQNVTKGEQITVELGLVKP